MSEFQPFCQNGTRGLIKRSWSGWHQVICDAETIILPSVIEIICSTGLVGNILIVFTIISYTTSLPRQRVMGLTKMVLVLISVFVVSTAHVIQLRNLQVSQPILTFYMSYYISICLSYASSSINPFLYILLSRNFQKHLQQCTNMELRMAEGMSTSLKTPSSQVFERRFFSQEKMNCPSVDCIGCNR